MGILCSKSSSVTMESRIEFLEKTPFFMYLTSDTMKEFARCFPKIENVNIGESLLLRANTTYIVVKGELELSTKVPNAKGKIDTLEHLCKKKPGDVVNKGEAQKDAIKKLSQSAKKVVVLMDEVKTTAISNTQLLCCDSQLLEGFLGRHQELAEPINAIMKSHIQCLLSPLPFLSSVKDSQLRLLAAMCRYEAFDANQTVFEENTFGSKLYIVLDGEAAIMSCVNNTRNNAQQLCRSLELEKVSGSFLESKTDKNGMIELATVKSGDYFGETALIADIPRTTTVKTKTKALFVTVDKLDFANFFKVCPIKESMMKVTIERMLDKLSTLSIPFLSGIPEEKFKDLRDSARLHELSNGEVVFKQGDHGDRFYIVVHGQVKIETRTTIDEKEVSLPIPPPDDGMPRRMTEIGRLGAGKYFGEMALVTDKKRSATVLSHGKSILLSIDKMSFHNIIGSNTLALSEFGLRLLKRNIELHHLLGHPNGVPFFKSYLQQSHADENLDFWLRIKSFEEKYNDLEAKLNNASEMGNENGEDGIDDHDPNEDIWNEAKDIFVTFCDEFAQNQVNIPATMRIGLKTAIFEREDGSKLPFELFESAKKEIYRIMARDSFPRFKTSPEFKAFFDSVGILLD